MAQRRIVNFFGQVQGVGFRYTAVRLAGGYDITGSVCNMPDGSVECVIEGEPQEIDAFIADLVAELGHHIRRQTQQTAPCTGQFWEFGVKF